MKSYIVVGMGRFGTAVARKLQELGNEVLIMDENPDEIRKLSDQVTYAVVGNAQDEAVLRALDVGSFDCGVVAIGEDLAASILITLNLKMLGVPKVICKARDEQQKRALEKIGADLVLIPEREMALKLAQNLSSSSVLDYIELSPDCGIAEVRTPKGWVGKTLRELNIRAKFGVNVIALRDEKGQIAVTLDPNRPLSAQDVVVVLGSNEDLIQVQKL